MTLGEYLIGLGYFAGTVGCVLAAAALLVRRRLPHLAGAEGVLAFGVLATAGLVAAHVVPGALGLLSRTSALLTAVVLLAAATRVRSADAPRAQGGPSPRPPPPGTRLSWVVAGLAAAGVAVAAVAAAWSGTGAPSTESDTLTFHLPNIARWIQTGSVWGIHDFAPLQPTGHYPQSGDVVVMSTLLPWKSDAFVRAAGLPFFALSALAVYAIAKEAGASRASGVLLGALFASVPAFAIESFEGAKTDPVMVACFGAGVLFLVRHLRTRLGSDLVLAGVALGVALGTKWYGVTNIAAVLLAWAGLWLLTGRGPRPLLRAAAPLAGLIAAAGGFWMLRNLVKSGNPVFPVRVGAAGIELFDAPRDFMRECAGFAVAHYLDEPKALKEHFYPAYRDLLGLPGLALGAGWLAAAAIALRARLGRRGPVRSEHAVPLFLAVCVALQAVAYCVTPYTAFGPPGLPTQVAANVRWLAPALLLAAALTALVASRPGRWRAAVELALLLAVADGIRRGFSDSAAAVAGAVGVVGACAAAAYLVVVRRPSPRALAALAAAGLLALAVVGYPRQRAFHDERYSEVDAALAWVLRHAREDGKVGLAGIWPPEGISPVLPSFGAEYDNEVSYVGRAPDGLMLEYETRPAFMRAVERAGYDVVLVGRGAYPDPGICEIPGRGRSEAAWLRRGGYRTVAQSERFVALRAPKRSETRP
jgi:Dolichyl-phosphate-mannose-protein mannosyltransferase